MRRHRPLHVGVVGYGTAGQAVALVLQPEFVEAVAECRHAAGLR